MAYLGASNHVDHALSSRSVFASIPSAVGNNTEAHITERYKEDESRNVGGLQRQKLSGINEDREWHWTQPGQDSVRFPFEAHDHVVDEGRQHRDLSHSGARGTYSPDRPQQRSESYLRREDIHPPAGVQLLPERNRSGIEGDYRDRNGATSPEEEHVDTLVGASSAQAPEGLPTRFASASDPLDDQPIRGLASRDLSLDELIAQGERQMQEAQAKTSSARSVSGRPRAPRSLRGSPSPPPPAPVADAASPRKTRPTTVTPGNHGEHLLASEGGGRARQGAGTRARTTADRDGDQRGSDVSNRGQSSPRAPGASARSVSSFTGNASFATSWSGGDPEQLGQISMGVLPAAGGDEDARAEEAERERREFFELEMELLREEEMQSARGERDQHVVAPDGSREEAEGDAAPGSGERDEFWDDGGDRESNAGGTAEGGSVGRSSLTGELAFRAAGPVDEG